MSEILYLICGHGDGDCGAVGFGYTEAERVRYLASRMKLFGGSRVIVGDTKRNFYKDRLVNNNVIPKGALVLELHMDSWADPKSKGAHVVINAKFDADEYDKKLANYISNVFVGRSEIISKRSDLRNVNMAGTNGINYRLLECGFISNAYDVKIFNSRTDEIAKGILNCFNIPIVSEPSEPVSKPSESSMLYRVQVGAFRNKNNADNLVTELKSKGYDAFITS